MWQYSHQPKMIRWVFHVAIEKQIYTHERLQGTGYLFGRFWPQRD